jgi:hypothetical protein
VIEDWDSTLGWVLIKRVIPSTGRGVLWPRTKQNDTYFLKVFFFFNAKTNFSNAVEMKSLARTFCNYQKYL